MRLLALLLAVCLLTTIGCGGGDPNQSVADRLVSHSLVDLNELCGRASVYGHAKTEQWVIHDIDSGVGKSFADSHIFTGGATPGVVAADLISRCQPDGGFK